MAIQFEIYVNRKLIVDELNKILRRYRLENLLGNQFRRVVNEKSVL